MKLGKEMRNTQWGIEERESVEKPIQQRKYGQRQSKEMTSTKHEYKEGKDSRASTFAQNIVRGGSAPSLQNAKKEETR